MNHGRRFITILFTLLTFLGVASSAHAASENHYYVLIGGTCDPDAQGYKDSWLAGGIPLRVHYPAGATGLIGCDTPMDISVKQGAAETARILRETYSSDPTADFTIVGYSQGAIITNLVLSDILDGNIDIDKSKLTARFYADPMQPEGPPSRGISTLAPQQAKLSPSTAGLFAYGPGRKEFQGIPFTRYCIRSDGICDAVNPELLTGFFSQHSCYNWIHGIPQRSIMGDTIATDDYTHRTVALPRQNCRLPLPYVENSPAER